MTSLTAVRKAILAVISRSPVPEDPGHAENTLSWLLRLRPDAGMSMQIAALGHDIERAVSPRT